MTTTCPTCNGTPTTPFCSQCGTKRPGVRVLSKQESIGKAIIQAVLESRFGTYHPSADKPGDRVAIYEQAKEFLAAEKPAPSADSASVEELAKALFPLIEKFQPELNWHDVCAVAAAAIAHCGQNAAEQRQRAEKAESDRERGDGERLGLHATIEGLRSEVERLKAELRATMNGVVRILATLRGDKASQPAPQAGLPEVGDSRYMVKDTSGEWESATVESVADGHVELLGKSGVSRLRRLSDEGREWRRVAQPKAENKERP